MKIYISASCRYAATLDFFTPLGGSYPDPAMMINTPVHKLKAALTWILPPIDDARIELLLWLLAVGGISAVNKGERGIFYEIPDYHWFVGQLVVLVADLNIKG